MGYLAEHKEEHQLALAFDANFSIRSWATWYCAAELMRRHPGTFRPVDRFTMQKELLDLETTGNGDQLMIRINKIGWITVWGNLRHQENCRLERGVDSDDKFLTLDVFFAPNPREIILDLEECAGLKPTRETPATQANTIGPRVIAELLKSRLHTARPLYAQGVFQSSEYGDGINQGVLSGFKGLADLANLNFEVRWNSINDHPVPLFSSLFVVREGRFTERSEDFEDAKPLFVVDIEKGKLHTKQKTVDLMSEYRKNNGSIEFTVAKLLFENN